MGEREKILIADDNPYIRKGLKAYFSACGTEHEIIAEAGSVEEVRSLIEKGATPTVAIVDGNMPNYGDGEKAAEIIREVNPGTKIISFSSTPQRWGDVNLEKIVSGSDIVKTIDQI